MSRCEHRYIDTTAIRQQYATWNENDEYLNETTCLFHGGAVRINKNAENLSSVQFSIGHTQDEYEFIILQNSVQEIVEGRDDCCDTTNSSNVAKSNTIAILTCCDGESIFVIEKEQITRFHMKSPQHVSIGCVYTHAHSVMNNNGLIKGGVSTIGKDRFLISLLFEEHLVLYSLSDVKIEYEIKESIALEGRQHLKASTLEMYRDETNNIIWIVCNGLGNELNSFAYACSDVDYERYVMEKEQEVIGDLQRQMQLAEESEMSESEMDALEAKLSLEAEKEVEIKICKGVVNKQQRVVENNPHECWISCLSKNINCTPERKKLIVENNAVLNEKRVVPLSTAYSQFFCISGDYCGSICVWGSEMCPVLYDEDGDEVPVIGPHPYQLQPIAFIPKFGSGAMRSIVVDYSTVTSSPVSHPTVWTCDSGGFIIGCCFDPRNKILLKLHSLFIEGFSRIQDIYVDSVNVGSTLELSLTQMEDDEEDAHPAELSDAGDEVRVVDGSDSEVVEVQDEDQLFLSMLSGTGTENVGAMAPGNGVGEEESRSQLFPGGQLNDNSEFHMGSALPGHQHPDPSFVNAVSSALSQPSALIASASMSAFHPPTESQEVVEGFSSTDAWDGQNRNNESFVETIGDETVSRLLPPQTGETEQVDMFSLNAHGGGNNINALTQPSVSSMKQKGRRINPFNGYCVRVLNGDGNVCTSAVHRTLTGSFSTNIPANITQKMQDVSVVNNIPKQRLVEFVKTPKVVKQCVLFPLLNLIAVACSDTSISIWHMDDSASSAGSPYKLALKIHQTADYSDVVCLSSYEIVTTVTPPPPKPREKKKKSKLSKPPPVPVSEPITTITGVLCVGYRNGRMDEYSISIDRENVLKNYQKIRPAGWDEASIGSHHSNQSRQSHEEHVRSAGFLTFVYNRPPSIISYPDIIKKNSDTSIKQTAKIERKSIFSSGSSTSSKADCPHVQKLKGGKADLDPTAKHSTNNLNVDKKTTKPSNSLDERSASATNVRKLNVRSTPAHGVSMSALDIVDPPSNKKTHNGLKDESDMKLDYGGEGDTSSNALNPWICQLNYSISYSPLQLTKIFISADGAYVVLCYALQYIVVIDRRTSAEIPEDATAPNPNSDAVLRKTNISYPNYPFKELRVVFRMQMNDNSLCGISLVNIYDMDFGHQIATNYGGRGKPLDVLEERHSQTQAFYSSNELLQMFNKSMVSLSALDSSIALKNAKEASEVDSDMASSLMLILVGNDKIKFVDCLHCTVIKEISIIKEYGILDNFDMTVPLEKRASLAATAKSNGIGECAVRIFATAMWNLVVVTPTNMHSNANTLPKPVFSKSINDLPAGYSLKNYLGIYITVDGNLFSFDGASGYQIFLLNIFEYVADMIDGQDIPDSSSFRGGKSSKQTKSHSVDHIIQGLEVFHDAMRSPIAIIWTMYTIYAIRLSFEVPSPSCVISSSVDSGDTGSDIDSVGSSVYSHSNNSIFADPLNTNPGKPEVGFKSMHSFKNSVVNPYASINTNADGKALSTHTAIPYEVKVVRFIKYSFVKEGVGEGSEHNSGDFPYFMKTCSSTDKFQSPSQSNIGNSNKARVMYVTPMRNPQFDDIYNNTLPTTNPHGKDQGLPTAHRRLISASRSHKLLVVLSDGTVHIMQY